MLLTLHTSRLRKSAATGLGTLIVAAATAIPGPALATVFDVEAFYTLFSGNERVKKVEFTYDDGTKTLGTPTKTLIATAAQMTAASGSAGADGIVGNPNDAGSLLVAGQNTGLIYNVNKSGGVAGSTSAGVTAAFHMEVVSSSTLYVSGIPGLVGEVTLNPDGSLNAGIPVALLGDETVITQLITTPSGFFYTSGGAGGNGAFGTATIVPLTSITTTRLDTPVAAAHGGVYDPFSDSTRMSWLSRTVVRASWPRTELCRMSFVVRTVRCGCSASTDHPTGWALLSH